MKLSDVKEIIEAEFIGPSDVLERSYCGVSIDSRVNCKDRLFFALKGEKRDGHEFVKDALEKGAVAAVVKRPVNTTSPQFVVGDTLSALQKLGMHIRKARCNKVIAITGSSGKTTTKEMLKFLLRKFVKVSSNEGTQNNLIGVPFNLANVIKSVDIYVAELGTNMPGEIRNLSLMVEPDISVITCIGEAHLEGLKDIHGVFREKISIIDGMREGFLIYREDMPYVDEAKKIVSLKGIEFIGVGVPGSFSYFEILGDSRYRFFINGKSCDVELSVRGVHNAFNALIALTCVSLLDYDWRNVAEALGDFPGVDKRFRILELSNVTLIDDTYNANPISTKAAIDFLSRRKGIRVLVFGSMLELGEHSERLHREVGEYAFRKGIDLLVTYGEEARYTLEAFKECGGEGFHFDTHEDIVQFLCTCCGKDSVILVKGSRGMKMERVVDGVMKCFGN